jgi:4-diphosphocytidyl-2-C-methyl-D-erythritol kinase
MTRDVRVVARAKLTLSLRVLGRRADGFHDLEALVVSLRDPHDVVGLRIQPPFGVRVRLSGRAVIGVPVDETNLAARAARLLLDAAADGEDTGPWAASGLDISLHKTIPAGAGLGGGSADAAAILRWADVLDPAVAAALGADVPFCVVGGRARVTGVGEAVEPLPFEDAAFTLLTPPLHVATPAVYAEWDRLGGPVDPNGVNDLEPAALSLVPDLARYRDRLGDATGRTPALAGSGGTWFVAGEFEGDGLV